MSQTLKTYNECLANVHRLAGQLPAFDATKQQAIEARETVIALREELDQLRQLAGLLRWDM